jgi:hypothetical protein
VSSYSTNSASVQRQEEDKREKERRQKEQQRLTAAQTRGEAKQKVVTAERLRTLIPLPQAIVLKFGIYIYIYTHIRCALFEIVQSYWFSVVFISFSFDETLSDPF